MSELVESLRGQGHLEDVVIEPRTDPRIAPSRRRRRRLLAAALGAALLAAVGTAVALRARSSREASSAAPPRELPRVVGAAIELPPGFREGAGIATERATRGPLAPLVTVVGQAAFDPTRVAAVGTRASGIVQKVFFVEGAVVEEGDVLADVESPAVAEVVADRRIAQAKREAAEQNAQRETGLLERGLTTAREHEQAMAQLAEQRALEVAANERVAALGGARGGGISQLRAPVSGVVAERSVAPGQSVGPGLVAFRVGSLERLWILLRVYERHLEGLRLGDSVEIHPVATPERVISGEVAHVGNVIDGTSHTADVRVEVGNEDRSLRPGQAVRATIRASGAAVVGLSVPDSAVVSIDGAPTVFVAESPTRFVARTVELGLDAGDRVEVKSGIEEGEEVVTKSVLAVKAELFR